MSIAGQKTSKKQPKKNRQKMPCGNPAGKEDHKQKGAWPLNKKPLNKELEFQLGKMDEDLKSLLETAVAIANEIGKPFWEKSKQIRDNKDKRPKDWFKFAFVVRWDKPKAINDSHRLFIGWKKLEWIKTLKGNFLTSNSVKKNADGSYSINQFKEADPEELILIENMNEELIEVWDVIKYVGYIRKTRSNVFRKYHKED